jgi:phosphoglycolate phosphatase-like HAD superfamily hydrolase
MTDPAIVRHGLRTIGKSDEPTGVAEVLDAYLTLLEESLPRAPRFRVIEHVTVALSRAKERGHRLGLGTGNLERGASIKLGHAKIADWFEFGGYSSDAEDRAELLARGVERGRVLAGSNAEVVVIGDTPRDIAAARAIGATCIAVATGRFTVEDLERHGADCAVQNLADDRVWSVI